MLRNNVSEQYYKRLNATNDHGKKVFKQVKRATQTRVAQKIKEYFVIFSFISLKLV